ncbi:MAG TPA: YCF48-related protein, partial [Phycisphaerae bacterium]|nr:YCF48-related protein [Phycisphaerae bacterium]
MFAAPLRCLAPAALAAAVLLSVSQPSPGGGAAQADRPTATSSPSVRFSGGSPVRALLAQPAAKPCWAVGDAGLILRSDDAGKTWKQIQSSVTAHFQAVTVSDGAVCLYGGRAVPGHPAGAGRPVLLRTDDEGESFRQIRVPEAGWLYGGALAGESAGVFGQATAACPGGVWRSVTGGALWSALPVRSRGSLLGGDFRTSRLGCLVGQDYRIVGVRDLREALVQPPAVDSALSLRAVRIIEGNTCWVVGDNGSVLRGEVGQRAWPRIRAAIPRGLGRCADFETITIDAPNRIWIAGGLLGVVAHSADAGKTWKLL